MMVARLVVVWSLSALLVGCSTAPRHSSRATRTPDQPAGPAIVYLVGRHQTITVTSSPRGPLYSATTAEGETIVANATLDELRVSHPEVYRLVEPGVAADARYDAGR